MAEEEDLDLDVESTEKKSSGMNMKMMIIIMAVFLVVVIGVAVGAVMFLSGGDSGETPTEMTEGGAVEPDALPEEAEVMPTGDAVYVAIDPPFVVNFEDQTLVRYLQIGVTLLTKDPEGETKIRTHMPMLKSRMLLMYSAKTYEDVRTLEGKQNLQSESLKIAQEVLKQQTGGSVVESVLFTSFVMQ
ncbi:hypothetical protein BOW53_00690 [Solemya pervernicosa gill symbiont]|uniref:Flagellar protein FliL n=1 Tax=Solemya pervernicosa gill symbiont TaxID=642797 RepID=A0A1T2LAL2_9GAMM|nr:flagellar basal body-associated FliL family protein [Solemya pervernicosa gill symbiont]OOZ42131.1 hypothetical protein BOW53_00690 [Solemya pervernicosa gill symbiont]